MRPDPFGLSGPTQLYASVGRSVVQSITNATSTPVVFDTPSYNIGGMWQPNLGSRVVVPVRGIYTLIGGVSWAANGTGIRYLWFRKNLSDSQAFGPQVAQLGSATINDAMSTSEVVLNPGEIVELIVHQTSGGPLDLNAVLRFYPMFIVSLKLQL